MGENEKQTKTQLKRQVISTRTYNAGQEKLLSWKLSPFIYTIDKLIPERVLGGKAK